jgi:Protein of unknown function (DUF1569)
MKSLLNPGDKEEVLVRVHKTCPTSSRLWGKMSAHQMICHLSDGFRMYMGLKTVAPVGFPYPSRIMKSVALWAPIPWPKGFKSVPELDQQKDGTPPEEFDRDVKELKNLVDRFMRQPRDYEWQPHPHFGQMSEKEWMRLAYLHMDHHLRQFGV